MESMRMPVTSRKIVHVTSVHRPLDVRVFEKYCKSLASHGAQVVLIAVQEHDEVREGVVIRGVPRPANRLSRMTLTAWRVFREAWRQHPDLIHLHDPELVPWGNLLRLLRFVVVYDMHENVPKDMHSKSWLPVWLRWPVSFLIRMGERLWMAGMPVIFAEYSYAADYRWVRRSQVILNMPRLESLPSPAAPGKELSVGYIGAVSEDRGSLITLQALDLLRQRGLAVGWECVGPFAPADHIEQLRARVEQLGLTSVRFHGYVPSQQGWQRIQPCHVGLAVLLPRPYYIDCYPTKLFEYMAMGMPVVTSRFPLYQEVVERHDCGICVDPDSPVQLADAIEALLRDPTRARQQGERGRQAVLTQYNWNHEFEKLEQFYEQLMPPSRSRES
jgi:glycosyltransferase involved in cell wall biosynthesis